MSPSAHAASRDGEEALDLAALGRTYAPPQPPETSVEVAEVISRTPWWAARGLIYLIIAFFVVALLWANFSMMDVVAEARAVLVPEGYVKPVQAAGVGIVQSVLVHEGDNVERGQALVQLDATELRTRLSKLREELTSSRQALRDGEAGVARGAKRRIGARGKRRRELHAELRSRKSRPDRRHVHGIVAWSELGAVLQGFGDRGAERQRRLVTRTLRGGRTGNQGSRDEERQDDSGSDHRESSRTGAILAVPFPRSKARLSLFC